MMRLAFAGKWGDGRMPLNGFWMAAAPPIASRPSNPNRAAPPSPYAKRPKNSRRLIPKLICEHDMAISHHNSPEKCVVSRGTGGRNPKPEIRNSAEDFGFTGDARTLLAKSPRQFVATR